MRSSRCLALKGIGAKPRRLLSMLHRLDAPGNDFTAVAGILGGDAGYETLESILHPAVDSLEECGET